MMGRRLRAVLALICLTLGLGVTTLATPARAMADEGVTLTLTSDKEAYEAGETATLTLAVTNGGSGTAQDVVWTVELPEGMNAADGQELTGSFGELAAGETRSVEIAASVTRSVSPGDNGGDATTDKGGTTDDEGLPTTGDNAVGMLPLVAVLAGGGLLALAAARRLRGNACALVLIAGTAAALALAGATPAHAETAQRMTSTSCTVTAAGKSVTVNASATYTYESAPDEPVVDPDEPGDDEPHYNVEFRDDVMVFDEYQVVEENGEKGYLVPAAAVEEQLQKVSAATADAKQESAEAEVQPAMLRAAAAPAGQFLAIDTLDDTIMGADGPMCAFTGNEDEPSGFAGRMLSYEWRPNFDDPMLFLKVTQADDPRDVFEHIDVLDRAREAESYDDLAFADGVSGAVSDDGALEFTLSGFEAGNTESKVVVAFKPIFDFDIDWDMDGFNKCFVEMGVRTDVDGDFTVTGFDREIDLLARPAFVHLGYGFDVAINLVLDVSAEGEVSLHVDLIDTVTATYKDGEFELDSGDDTPAKNDDGWIVNGTVRIGVGPVAWLRVFSIELIDVSGEIGLEGTGGITDRTPYPVVCRDLGLYLYLELGVGDNTN